jgi:secreted Zn-dependent insulinase-like peptidase
MLAQVFVPRLLGELYIEALVHGNATQAEAEALADAVRGALPAAKWLPAEARPQDHCTALQPGATYLYRHVSVASL